VVNRQKVLVTGANGFIGWALVAALRRASMTTPAISMRACPCMSSGISARFVLVGKSDTENPTAVPVTQLVEWQQ
jgi:NAD(P)-dependent dehydrogenase (short-subunit alcohol dehydrogenase family)